MNRTPRRVIEKFETELAKLRSDAIDDLDKAELSLQKEIKRKTRGEYPALVADRCTKAKARANALDECRQLLVDVKREVYSGG